MPASVSFLTVEFRSRWIRFHYAGDNRTFFSVGKKYKNTHPHNATFSCLAQSHLFAHYSAVCFVSAAESRGLKALIEFRRKESRQTMSRPAGKEHRFQLVRNPTHRTRPHTCTMKLLVSSRHRARFGGLSLHQVVRPAAARGLWINPDGNTIKGCARPKCNVGLHIRVVPRG